MATLFLDEGHESLHAPGFQIASRTRFLFGLRMNRIPIHRVACYFSAHLKNLPARFHINALSRLGTGSGLLARDRIATSRATTTRNEIASLLFSGTGVRLTAALDGELLFSVPVLIAGEIKGSIVDTRPLLDDTFGLQPPESFSYLDNRVIYLLARHPPLHDSLKRVARARVRF